jgi:hypothetical protein
MPMHINELTSEVAIASGDLPLSQTQLDKLVNLVMHRMTERHRQAALTKEATKVDQSVVPPLKIGSQA